MNAYLLGCVLLGVAAGLRLEPAHLSPSNPGIKSTMGGWKTIRVWMGNPDSYGPWSAEDHTGTWHGQAGQDISVAKLFNGKKNGYFVDLAANKAITLSNSRTLERDYGWDGLCVEANPAYWSDLAFRKCQVVAAVVGSKTNDTANLKFSNGELGGIVSDNTDNQGESEASRSVVSLADLLVANGAPATIDYMSLDVEGAEEMILGKFPFGEYTFLVLTIERPSETLQNVLKDNGYMYVQEHGNFGDKMYVHNSFPNLDAAITRLELDLVPGTVPTLMATKKEHRAVKNALLCEDGGRCPRVTVNLNP